VNKSGKMKKQPEKIFRDVFSISEGIFYNKGAVVKA
jgi:hypothetical protein